MYQFIQVLYPNNRRGPVDDITLNELIRSQRITRFYRPAEQSWVNIFVDPVRGKGDASVLRGLRRRASDTEEDDQQEEREENSGGLLRQVFKRRKKHPPGKALSAQEWFERGFAALRITNDYAGAARAFALSIRLNPVHQRAYINRGLAYEQLGNIQQAIEDYSMAIVPDPDDGKPYYFRGLAFKRLGMAMEAIADLKRAANLQHVPALRLLASRTELREAVEAPAERRREGQASNAGTEGFPEVPGGLQRPIEEYRKEITQPEAEDEEVKRKHDIPVEDSRLLEKKVLIPHRNLYEELSAASKEKD